VQAARELSEPFVAAYSTTEVAAPASPALGEAKGKGKGEGKVKDGAGKGRGSAKEERSRSGVDLPTLDAAEAQSTRSGIALPSLRLGPLTVRLDDDEEDHYSGSSDCEGMSIPSPHRLRHLALSKEGQKVKSLEALAMAMETPARPRPCCSTRQASPDTCSTTTDSDSIGSARRSSMPDTPDSESQAGGGATSSASGGFHAFPAATLPAALPAVECYTMGTPRSDGGDAEPVRTLLPDFVASSGSTAKLVVEPDGPLDRWLHGLPADIPGPLLQAALAAAWDGCGVGEEGTACRSSREASSSSATANNCRARRQRAFTTHGDLGRERSSDDPCTGPLPDEVDGPRTGHVAESQCNSTRGLAAHNVPSIIPRNCTCPMALDAACAWNATALSDSDGLNGSCGVVASGTCLGAPSATHAGQGERTCSNATELVSDSGGGTSARARLEGLVARGRLLLRTSSEELAATSEIVERCERYFGMGDSPAPAAGQDAESPQLLAVVSDILAAFRVAWQQVHCDERLAPLLRSTEGAGSRTALAARKRTM